MPKGLEYLSTYVCMFVYFCIGYSLLQFLANFPAKHCVHNHRGTTRVASSCANNEQELVSSSRRRGVRVGGKLDHPLYQIQVGCQSFSHWTVVRRAQIYVVAV